MTAIKIKSNRRFLGVPALTVALAVALTLVPIVTSRATITVPSFEFNQNKRPVPNYDINLTQFVTRLPTAAQLEALASLKTRLGDQNITARWDRATGSVDTIYDFASSTSPLEPEAAARDFIIANSSLFGITDTSTLRLRRNVEAFGGSLLNFEQTYGGAGSKRRHRVLMDGQRRIKMISGPYHSNLSFGINPFWTEPRRSLRHRAIWSPTAGRGQRCSRSPKSALDLLASQLGVLATPHPELNVFPTQAAPGWLTPSCYSRAIHSGCYDTKSTRLRVRCLPQRPVRYQQQQLPDRGHLP
jgi:hypothetical protein